MLRLMMFFLMCVLGVSTALAQALRVRIAPTSIYAGDAFRVEASVDGANLESVTCTFSMPTQVISQSTSITSINGRVSSSRSLQILPQGVGTCQLESLTAVTEDGRTLTYSEPQVVQVRALEPDGEVFIETAVTPEAPLPGDEVVVTLKVRAPAIQEGGRFLSPFLEQSFFGQVQERLPRIQFESATGEDSPLRQVSEPRLAAKEIVEGNLVWTITCAYRAVRVGEQTFPAPFIRDTRYRLAQQGGSLEETRCLVMGTPITVRVEPPPTEGRPEGFTGAVASRFAAEVTLDALNVKAGDPVKLTVTFLTDADVEQLRMPHLPELKGFRSYGEPVRNTIEGGCAFVYNLRPVQSGLLEIPSLSFAWFEKAQRVYQLTHTVAVPLYVHPSAQLVLLGEDGETLSNLLPAALRMDLTETAPVWPHWRAFIALGVGVLALLCRILVNPMRWVWYRVVQRLTRKRPVRRVCATLRRVRTPAEALAAIRVWTGRPALTAVELRQLLEPSPEASAVVTAMAQLEHALYASGEDVSEARETLIQLLPQVKFSRVNSAGMRMVVIFALCLLPSFVMAEADAFLVEQAEALSLSASTSQDYAAATDLWLRIAREGNTSKGVLLNAAGCAVFAQQAAVAKGVIARYELLYGRDAESEQTLLAALDRLEEPLFWGRTLFAWHYNTPFVVRLEALCIISGVLLLLVALPWRRLAGARLVWGILLAAIAVSVVASWMSLSQTQVFDALPTETETEAQS